MLQVVEDKSPPPEQSAKKKKIAIVGTAPQWDAAPFDNPDWEIWGLLGVATMGKRLTRLYELHKAEVARPLIESPPHAGKYWDVARALGKNFITQADFPETPEATRFDFKAHLDKYGPYFASTAAWMLADAIDQEPEEIAIYGVNMAHESEYGYQKPSCTFMIGYAKAKGIKVSVPTSSELLFVPFQYGIENPPRVMEIFGQKKKEYTHFRELHRRSAEQAQANLYTADQCLELLKWFEQNLYTPSGGQK